MNYCDGTEARRGTEWGRNGSSTVRTTYQPSVSITRIAVLFGFGHQPARQPGTAGGSSTLHRGNESLYNDASWRRAFWISLYILQSVIPREYEDSKPKIPHHGGIPINKGK